MDTASRWCVLLYRIQFGWENPIVSRPHLSIGTFEVGWAGRWGTYVMPHQQELSEIITINLNSTTTTIRLQLESYTAAALHNHIWSSLHAAKSAIYLRLVNTKGVAFGKLRILASDCSFPSLVGSSTLPEPEKGQNPLDLEPLPPIFSCSTLFSWVTGQPVMLQLYCTRMGLLWRETRGRVGLISFHFTDRIVTARVWG